MSEFFMATNPGLSSYAEDPKAAANSLEPLLEGAEGAVPQELQSETPFGTWVKNQSTFHSKDQWVTILDGTQEGSYMWAAINYLLGNLGKDYKSTTATIDLGGVQFKWHMQSQRNNMKMLLKMWMENLMFNKNILCPKIIILCTQVELRFSRLQEMEVILVLWKDMMGITHMEEWTTK
ncbi:Apyrase [Datura stramonium]|uniref:Apyrase n=1 Tax=Datura stramonium TaxID=4076 RepID=A0ABS8UVS2_DATST|nr:Apyrase [Datura stramonium]